LLAPNCHVLPSLPAPLQVAVQLYHLISQDLVPNSHDWLVHRWQAAARKDWELLRAKWMQADPQPLLELVQVRS
jgi:hypothetical protein